MSNKCIALLVVVAGLIYGSLWAEETVERWFWPLGESAGEVILRPGYVENPVHKNVFLNHDYFIAGTAGQPVYSPVDGVIIYTSLFEINYPSNYESMSFHTYDSFLQLKEESSDPILNERNLTAGIGIQAHDGSYRVWFSGLADLQVEKGQRIAKGELLGTMGYIRTFLHQPCIQISKSGVKPDLGLYLLGEDNSAFYTSLPKPVSIDPKKSIEGKQLTAAWEIFSQAILEDHPAMLDSSLKQAFSAVLASYRPDEAIAFNAYQFASLLKKAVATLHCTHTKIRFVNSRSRYPVPPLDLALHGGEVFVFWDKRSTKTMAPGTKVVAINGKPVAEIISELCAMISVDARSEAVQLEIVENYFAILLPVLFEYPELWKYGLANSNEDVQQEVISCLNLEEVSDEAVLAEWQKIETPTFEVLDASTAVLTLWSVDQARDHETVAGWFKELQERGIANLILDLRDNGGGDIENAALLFSYFAKQPFSEEAYSEIVHAGQYNSMKHSLNMPYLETENYPGMFTDYQQATDGRYIKYSDQMYQPIVDYGFSGKVFVMVDSGTASAAVWLARVLAEQGAVTIGTETGGGFYGTNALKFNIIKLGETGLQLRMPLFWTAFAQSSILDNPQHRGLIPAYLRSRTLEDKLYGTDSILDFTLDLIANPPPEPERVLVVKDSRLYVFAGIGVLLVIALVAFIVLAIKRKLDSANS